MRDLAQIKEQSYEFWNNLNRQARMGLVGLALFTLVVILLLVFWAGRPEYVPLYTDLALEDAAEITDRLEEMNISYRLAADGRRVLVPAGNVHRVRLKLAGEGLPQRGVVGFEIFDESRLGTTEYERKVNFYRALQGELSRTILQIDEVSQARVHIVVPQPRLYTEEEEEPKASVLLGLRRGERMSAEQIRAIANMVAGSVENLSPNRVSIVDTRGNILSAQLEDRDQLPADKRELKRSLESDLAESVESMLLPVVGYGNAVVRVSVQLDLSAKEIESEIFEPVVGDEGVLRSREEIEEFYEGEGMVGGVPGVDTNIPTYQEIDPGESSYEFRNIIENFELNRRIIREHIAPGQIERLSVAVIVNEELSPDRQEQIQRLVGAAVGMDTERGDVIDVSGMDFAEEVALPAVVEPAAPWWLSEYLLIGLLGVVLLLFALYYVRRRRDLDREAEMEIEQFEEQAASEDDLSKEERERERIKQEVIELVRNRPEDVAQILKTWLTEE